VLATEYDEKRFALGSGGRDRLSIVSQPLDPPGIIVCDYQTGETD
jgi:hypothetical protein